MSNDEGRGQFGPTVMRMQDATHGLYLRALNQAGPIDIWTAVEQVAQERGL